MMTIVSDSLCLHDALHVGGPAILRGGQYTRRIGHPGAHHNLLGLIAQRLLHKFGERLELCLHLLQLLLLLVLVLQIQALLGRRLQLLAVKFLQLLHGILVDGVGHVQHFEAFLAKRLQEGRRGHCSDALASDVVDVVLALVIDLLVWCCARAAGGARSERCPRLSVHEMTTSVPRYREVELYFSPSLAGPISASLAGPASEEFRLHSRDRFRPHLLGRILGPRRQSLTARVRIESSRRHLAI